MSEIRHPRVTHELTPRTTMDALRKQAKRWLKDIEASEPTAVQRFRDIYQGDAPPKLREVQHALSHEFGFASWASLKQEVEDRARSHAQRVELFLEKGVHRYGTDPRTRKWGDYERDGAARGAMAARLLAKHPELARESIHTAVLAHDIDAVRALLVKDPTLASAPCPFDDWPPLIYLAYARLPLATVEANALAIATLLLDAGAHVSGQLKDYTSSFTALTGAIGGGEGGQSPHPQAEALARLLIDRGADPLDGQALYNTSLGADDAFWLEFMWTESEKRGDVMAARWHTAIPDTLGPPLEYLLGSAVPHHPNRVAWLLAHGARADTHNFYSKQPVIRHAALAGKQDMVMLLARHGAVPPKLDLTEDLVAAAARGDGQFVRKSLPIHPDLRKHAPIMLAAIEAGRLDMVALLLELGMSPDIGNGRNYRALHAAAHAGFVDAAHLLIRHGAEIDPVETAHNSTPLGHANYLGQKNVIALLAPFSRDIRGLCFCGETTRLQDLLSEDRSLASTPSRGEPPLFALPDDDVAAVEVAELLLSFGADPLAKNVQGLTPGDVARRRGLEDAAALLDP